MEERFKNIGHIFDQTVEECAEVIHIISKTRRFGFTNYHPKDPKKTPNYQLMLNEIDDLEFRLKGLREFITKTKARICLTCGGFGELSKPPYDDSATCSDCKGAGVI